MEYAVLGRTGVSVSRFGLGTMMFGRVGNPDRTECIKMVHAAIDAGVNLIDTADAYSSGESEEIVGEALRGRRDDVVVATKFRSQMGPGINSGGASRRWITRAVEDSLRRLGTDWIDLYQLHRPDPTCDLDETLSTLSDLVRSGKVRYIGSSTLPAEQLVEARWAAERGRHERFVCEELPYSIFSRSVETAVLPTCRRYGIGVLAWGPLNGGWLSGKYRRDRPRPEESRAGRAQAAPKGAPFHWFYAALFADGEVNDRKLDLVEQLAALADDLGRPLSHLAHAWALQHPAVTSVLMGPRTAAQLDDLLAATDLRLDADVLDRIDAIVPPGVELSSVDIAGAPPPGLSVSERRR